MTVRWYTVVVDSHDVATLGRWWAETLQWKIAFEAEDELCIVAPRAFDETRDIPVDERGPGLVFVTVPDDKVTKNRLHIDLAPFAGDDQDSDVQALLARGATLADVGQEDKPWVVLRDIEGNEFCVLTPRD